MKASATALYQPYAVLLQGPKQGSYLRNRPVMRLRRPAMSVARESMIRKLVVVKFLACTPGARTNPWRLINHAGGK